MWQYGTTGVSGSGVDQLVRPTSAQWLTPGADAGNVLICDEGAARVVEVRAADYEAGAGSHGFAADSLVWRYPAADGETARPSFALGASGADAIVWIADAAAGDILGVATGSRRVRRPVTTWSRGTARASRRSPARSPRRAPSRSPSDGALAVADPGADRVTRASARPPPPRSPRPGPSPAAGPGASSSSSVTCTYLAVPYAPIGVSVSVDGGDWTFLQGTLGAPTDGTGAIASGTLPASQD